MLDGLSLQFQYLLHILRLRFLVFLTAEHVLQQHYFVENGNEFHVQLHHFDLARSLHQILLPLRSWLQIGKGNRLVLSEFPLLLIPNNKIMGRSKHHTIGNEKPR
jgi:hypothetical protein